MIPLLRLRLFGGSPTAADLYLAIAERAEADAGLRGVMGDPDLLGPRVFVGLGDIDTPAPYVSLFPVGGDEGRNAGDSFWVREVVRASIFARTFAEAKRVAVLWGRAFHKDMEPLRMRDASFGQITTTGLRYDGEDTYQGRTLHRGYVEMTAITGRSVS